MVVLDNRNSFEYRLGKFKSAIDPQVANFRDFPQYIADHAPAWQAAGKRVAMYCTGGIRCEKTSACLHDLGIEVYQLDGGILNYFQSIPDAERDWEGECFCVRQPHRARHSTARDRHHTGTGVRRRTGWRVAPATGSAAGCGGGLKCPLRRPLGRSYHPAGTGSAAVASR
ncbi:rhodanese-like domain-containing protein [Undibacterium arcticum]